MADINTILRETSVIIGISDIYQSLFHTLNKRDYEHKAKSLLFKQYKKIQEKLSAIIDFSHEHVEILGNGYALAKIISEKLNIKKIESLNWVADDSPDRPYDITINGLNISLKEDSNILTNMGLYKLVNIMTSNNFSTLNIYKDFANKEYSEWFKYTFEGLLESYIKTYLNLDSDYIREYLFSNNDISELIVNHFEPNKNVKEKLTINDILEFRQQVINTIGNKSAKDKVNILSHLYSKCSTKTECLYLTRILINKPRLGVGEKVIISAIENLVEDPEVRSENNDYFFKCLVYLRDNLFHYNFSKYLIKDEFGPGKLFDVCLAKPEDLKSFIDSIKKKKVYNELLCEVKYDGERTQFHYDKQNNLLLLASRAHENQNDLYVELVKGLQAKLNKQTEIDNFIIDGEIVIYDTEQCRFGYFQDLRKKESNGMEHFKYHIIAFDILYFNDQPLYEKPLEERKELLHKYFYNTIPEIIIEPGSKLSLDLAYDELIHSIKEEYKKAKALSCEGLIIKLLGSSTKYHFSKRHWYKIKAIDDSSIDSLDLVPIAGFLGLGEKKGLYSSFLMAIYDPKDNIYSALCFVGTGFTFDDLHLIYDRYSNNVINEKPENYLIGKSKPNIYFKPSEVWEIGFDNFTQSMNYPPLKGLVSENINLGISLRFPRYIRQRVDKHLNQAANSDDLMSMYMNLYKNENKDYNTLNADEEINNLL